jgi:DNA-binding LacI/PurR family transcriptional regulator
VDNANASFRAVEHLILDNHKEIAIIDGPEDSYVSQERLRGYCAAMETYNLPIQETWIQRGTFTRTGGYHAMKVLREISHQPSAVYVANYEMTIGAILALHEMHVRIPEEMSFIGFDHFEAIDVVEPPLTVVEQPIERIGQMAAELLLKRLQGNSDDFPTVIKLNTKIMIRNSIQKI